MDRSAPLCAGRGTDTQDIVAHLLVNDNSVSNQAKTYRLTIRDEKGKVLADHVAVKKDDIYDLTIAASDVLAGQKTYTATLESSYTQDGKPLYDRGYGHHTRHGHAFV